MKPLRFWTLACAGALLLGPTLAKADTYGLLIGIADYPDIVDANGNRIKDEDGNFLDDDLHGPINDVNTMKDLLVNKYGVMPDNVKTILDGAANKNGFIDAVRWLLGKAKAGDQVVLYYSGHGGQIEDSTEEDGFEEVICLVDTLVSGDFFNEVAKDLSGKGVNATFLFDSCFSGGMSRDIFSFDGKPGAAKRKFIGGASVKNKSRVPDADLNKMKALAKGPKAEGGSYLFVMAGQENQPTSDLDFEDEATPDHGLFTLVLSILLNAEPDVTAGEVIDAMNEFLEAKGFEQRPMFEASSSERASQPIIH